MSALSRLKSWFGISAEGSDRGMPWGQGYLGSLFQGTAEGFFQRNLELPYYNAREVPAVYAAVMAQARAVALCHPHHQQIAENGAVNVQRTSWPARLLRAPNSYETFTQFITNVVSEMLFRGESLVVIIRDDRFVPVALHRIQHGGWQPHIDPETREIYYAVSENGNPVYLSEADFMVPARDVIHFRQHTPRHPLIGETPIRAAAMAIGINVALSASQASFFSQMRRPSGVLTTDEILTVDQMQQLRDAFDAQAQVLRQGGVPILSAGLKFQQMSLSSEDAQLIEAQRMSVEDIARVFGVPAPIIGDLSKATLQNAETLINAWLSMGLGSLLENIERSLDAAFRFGPDQRVEFDTSPLLRTAFQERIEGLTRAIQGGLMTVNEGRLREGLSPVEGGDQPLVQQQMVTLDYATSQRVEEPEPEPIPEPEPEPEPQERAVDADIVKALVISARERIRSAA